MQATLETLTADLRTALGNVGTVINAAPLAQPRFELFHGANSICSQKIRVVLAHHGIAYTSHAMNIFVGQSYLPKPCAAAHDRVRGGRHGSDDDA